MVDGDAGNGMVIVTITANREVKNIAIDDELLEDKEALEDYLILALNKAIDKANKINESEMAAAAKAACLIFREWICLNSSLTDFFKF